MEAIVLVLIGWVFVLSGGDFVVVVNFFSNGVLCMFI